MYHDDPRNCYLSFLARIGLIAAVAFVLAGTTACGDDDDNGDDDDDGNGHADAGWLEIETRGSPPTILAVWEPGEGWSDDDGNSITELPHPVQDDVDGLLPFVEEGPRASLTVRFFEPDGSEVEMETLSRDDDTRERTCSEYSSRYYPVDDETQILYWGLMRHPDSDNGEAQFIEVDGDPAGIFHCDHVHIYPRDAGSVDVEFLLWHGDHSDAVSDPITIVVEDS